jgi:hypothetical protein
MLRITLFAVTLGIAAASSGAEPTIDNERVTVWDITGVAPPAQHDFVAVSLSHRDRTHTELLVRGHAHAVITELK